MTFRSIHYPGEASRGVLIIRAQARPVALALIAVMTVGLAAALQGEAFLWPFVGATALAYLGAMAWGQNWLMQTISEIEVRGPFASIRSIWDTAGGNTEGLTPIYSARMVHGELTVGVGDSVMTLQRTDWPEFDQLTDALRAAALDAERLGALTPLDAS